jgi:hypothetical protein
MFVPLLIARVPDVEKYTYICSYTSSWTRNSCLCTWIGYLEKGTCPLFSHWTRSLFQLTNWYKRTDPLFDGPCDKEPSSRIYFTNRSKIKFHDVIAVPMFRYSSVILTVNRLDKVKLEYMKIRFWELWLDDLSKTWNCIHNQFKCIYSFRVSHSGGCKQFYFVGCKVLFSCLSLSLILKTEATCSSETSVYFKIFLNVYNIDGEIEKKDEFMWTCFKIRWKGILNDIISFQTRRMQI